MTIITFLLHIIACGEIEPCLSVASYFTVLPTEVSSFVPNFERLILLHNMESIRIIIRKEIGKIRRGGQITNIISETT